MESPVNYRSTALKTMTSDELLSKTISALRLPLIIGVVFIHNSSAELPGMDLSSVISQSSNWGNVDYIIKLVSTVLAACAVPMFFFFSGYLFFFKTQEITTEIWIKKLKTRLKSLFIPYLFWTLLGVIVYGLLANLPWTKSLFGNGYFELSWRYIGEQLTGLKLVDGEHIYQMGYHLWFLRDLLLMVIISPIFYISLKNNHIGIAVLLIAIWIGSPLIHFFADININSTSFIFFGLGAYFGINKLNFLIPFNRISKLIYIIYPLFVLADWHNLTSKYYVFPENIGLSIHAIMILTALPFWCNVTALCVRNGLIRNIDWLATASFFVYLIHIPFILPQIKKILYHLTDPQTQEMLVILYFSAVFLSVIISLILYKILISICPRFTRFITGGR